MERRKRNTIKTAFPRYLCAFLTLLSTVLLDISYIEGWQSTRDETRTRCYRSPTHVKYTRRQRKAFLLSRVSSNWKRSQGSRHDIILRHFRAINSKAFITFKNAWCYYSWFKHFEQTLRGLDTRDYKEWSPHQSLHEAAEHRWVSLKIFTNCEPNRNLHCFSFSKEYTNWLAMLSIWGLNQ